MFTFIDYENWNRKEIYEKFFGYTYSVTAEIDITDFREKTKSKGYKFYPSICWAIGKTVNSDADYRFARMNGKPGCYDKLKVHFNLLRNDGSNLFSHAVTPFTED
ncbi:MAG: CatA-like O-acetyltransferase, partial [Eubacteriales bacterium]|nr:CatA-like O-acetyltransferase [Eubacteriales bacterium]